MSGIAVVQNKTILVDRVSGVEYYVDTVHSDIANVRNMHISSYPPK